MAEELTAPDRTPRAPTGAPPGGQERHMPPTAWDDLVAAYTVLALRRDEGSNFVADLLDLLTTYAGNRQDRLQRVVELRTEAATLLGLTEDALADLERAITALESGETTRRGETGQGCHSALPATTR